MHLTISGSHKAFTRAEIEKLVRWMGKQILGPQLDAHIHINVILEAEIGSDFGRMLYFYSHKKMRHFDIAINQKCSRPAFIQTMAHEMTHVRQYARRELREYKTHIKWHGRKITIVKRSKDRDVRVIRFSHGKMRTYENFPWETDAERNADLMFNRYMKEEMNDN